MSLFADLVKDVVKTGPENVRKLVGALDNLPSDETLIRLIEILEKLSPYAPDLKRLSQNGGLERLAALAANLPDRKTLDRLLKVAPLLENIPDKETLGKLLDKAEDLKKFIDGMEGED